MAHHPCPAQKPGIPDLQPVEPAALVRLIFHTAVDQLAVAYNSPTGYDHHIHDTKTGSQSLLFLRRIHLLKRALCKPILPSPREQASSARSQRRKIYLSILAPFFSFPHRLCLCNVFMHCLVHITLGVRLLRCTRKKVEVQSFGNWSSTGWAHGK